MQTDWSPHRHGQQIRAAGRAETLSRNASRRNSSRTARQGVHEKVLAATGGMSTKWVAGEIAGATLYLWRWLRLTAAV
jgi:hypothetical protein